MKSKLPLLIIILTFGVSLFAQNQFDIETEKAKVIKVVEEAYLDGVFNIGDTDAMKKGFHKDFSLKGIHDGNISELTINKWIEIVDNKIKNGKYPPSEKYIFEFPIIELTQYTAMVCINVLQGSKQIYTDYLLLLKLSDGWKITDKVYFKH